VKCDKCHGACCESLHLRLEGTAARMEWLAAFAARQLPGPGAMVELEVRCSQLTAKGRCGIYEERPTICRNYVAGGEACLDVVKRRRTAYEYQQIRDDEDPPEL